MTDLERIKNEVAVENCRGDWDDILIDLVYGDINRDTVMFLENEAMQRYADHVLSTSKTT